MPEMKAMEFTDKLNLQPVTRPVPEPKAGEILIQVYATGGTPTEKLWYTPVIILIDPFLSDNPSWDKGWSGYLAGKSSTQGGDR
jgi:hypothetical protein